MAPSASLQSRINAFENIGSLNSSYKSNGGIRITPLSVPLKPTEEHILDSDSTSPTADALISIPPLQPTPTTSRPSSPPSLGRKSSLIHFSELASPKLKPVSTNGTGSTTSSSDSSRKPQLPPRLSPQVPPLPPRKPSLLSLRTTLSATPPPLPKRHASSPVSLSSPAVSNANSLLNPPEMHTYPPLSPRRGESPQAGFKSRHIPTSSTSSFHSVSLSSDGGDTHESLDGSFETVGSTVATSPTASSQFSWEHELNTPKPSQRSWQKQSVSSPVSNPASPPPVSMVSRRQAPPPPQRRPITKTESSPAHHRPAPIPSNAKKRYDALFDRNLPQYSRKGRSSGWRGLSVDLLTTGEKLEFGDEERIDGAMVKQIWMCSKLPRGRLREIWNECDPKKVGSLDREAFAKGMWRIDEALNRAQQHSLKRPLSFPPKLSNNPTTYVSRVPPPPLRKPNFLLR